MVSHFTTALLTMIALCGQADTRPAQSPTQKEIEQAVKQLSDPSFKVRTQATEFLWSAGNKAEEAVRKAAASDDPEVAFRARSILNKFKFGIYPDTPPDIIELITQFRNGNESLKRTVLARIREKGHTRTVLQLLKTDMPENLRLTLINSVVGEIDKLVSTLLIDGDTKQAEDLFEIAASNDAGMRNYAVYLLLNGGIDKKIEELKLRFAQSSSKTDARFAMHLLRAKGDFAGAHPFAEAAGLLEQLLYEAGEWQQLVKLKTTPKEGGAPAAAPFGAKPAADPFGAPERKAPEGDGDAKVLSTSDVEKLGFLAAYQRLAGNTKEFEQIVTQLKTTPKATWRDDATSFYRAEALFANDRIDDAIEILKQARPDSGFILLVAQGRYREAFQLAGITDLDGPFDEWFDAVAEEVSAEPRATIRRFNLAVEVCRLLHRVGFKEEAKTSLGKLADAVKGDADGRRLSTVAKAEYRLMYRKEAYAHAAIVFEKQKSTSVLSNFFAKSLPPVKTLWPLFIRKPFDLEPAAAIEQLHGLFVPKSNELLETDELKIVLDPLIEAADKSEAKQQGLMYYALGELSMRHRKTDLAQELFEKAAGAKDVSAMLRLAEIAYNNKELQKAAKWNYQAWQENPLYPRETSGLYLSGWVLLKAGEQEEARRRIALARLLPLAGSTRRTLADKLRDKGLKKEARAEFELMMHCGTLQSWEVNYASQQLGNVVSASDPALASKCWERLLLSILKTSSAFVQTEGYLKLPHLIHKSRAKGLLKEGKTKEAVKEIMFSQSVMPADIPLGEELIPQLREAGEEKAADELFNKIYGRVTAVLDDFPNSAMHRNNAAWLAARAGKHLDEALAHSLRANELSPDNVSYLDTLAEVHFRRGNREEAIKFTKRCLELQPGNKHSQEQLERFNRE